MARNRSRQRKKSFVSAEISLTPLIDAVLVLLIIFMISMPIMNNSINIEIPKSSTNDATDKNKDAIVVAINKNNQIFINSKPVSKNEFIDEIEKLTKGSQESVIFVEGDQAVNYGAIIEVVDKMKYLAGIKYVALSTQNS